MKSWIVFCHELGRIADYLGPDSKQMPPTNRDVQFTEFADYVASVRAKSSDAIWTNLSGFETKIWRNLVRTLTNEDSLSKPEVIRGIPIPLDRLSGELDPADFRNMGERSWLLVNGFVATLLSNPMK